MFGFGEFQRGTGPFEKTGTVAINTEYHTGKKPLWLLGLKMLGVAAMVAVGAAIAVPTLLEFEFLLWQAIAITAGAMFVYTGISFFFRPEPNTDNLGWGGGMANDPFQSSDNVNRFLWKLHCVLGPGRFTAETFLDTCALLGLAKGDEVENVQAAETFAAVGVASPSSGFDARRPIAPLDPNRFALSSANSVTERIQRDSQRYGTSNSPSAAG
jgi:hypothetical protein